MSYGMQREYAQGTLLQVLKPNVNYCVTFYVALSNNIAGGRGTYAIDEFGAYLDDGSIKTGYLKQLM
jgi:hypothetical protein